ncbi:MAG TPA: response regulator FixJ [Ferrovibrio sp.]|jgi:two-component system response regulator FixJ|uniref:response regulator FixJ n=1 Tax=Ferrovibrio sp. TaxID=1917215 RepID=UPI002ED0BC5A
MTDTATIFVVDDDEAVRESLQALLETQGFTVKTYATAEAFLSAFAPDEGGCVLADLRMPGMDGLALLDRLTAKAASLPVIMVTGHGDVPLAVKAMKAGAVDFVEKPYGNETILEAVRRALGAQRRPNPETSASKALQARIAALTPRERDVLEQLVIGNPNKIIAYELQISPRTVEIHRANLMKKMEADSLSHLVRMALSAGIVGKQSR